MVYEEIVNELAARLSPRRMRHSRGVSSTAVELAQRYNVDVEQARLAGILHDCAREIPNNNLLQMVKTFGIVTNDVEIHAPFLLHAPIGAKLAQQQFGINDPGIAEAINFHTTGGPAMSDLAKVIYLADCIEPGRAFPGADKLRTLAKINLDDALLAAYDQSLAYLIRQGGLIHPATIAGRNSLLINLRK